MELAINYSCKQCTRLTAVALQSLAPGKTHRCHHCETPLILTDEALETFSRALYDQLPGGVDV